MTWNTQPGPDAAGATSARAFNHGPAGCTAAWEGLDVTSLAQRWVDGAPNYGIGLRAGTTTASEADTSFYKAFYSAQSTYGVNAAPYLIIDYDHLPVAVPDAAAPLPGATTTATPRLSVTPVTDPDPGETISYFFRATDTLDAETGFRAVESGWIADAFYQVPEGHLEDGVTYYWHVWTSDGLAWRVSGATPPHFTVDRGLGAGAASPTDTVGGVGVNLARGTVFTGVSSPTLATVAGPVGLSYAYNSAAPSATTGLTASYYDAPGTTPPDLDALAPVAVRTDPFVNFNWGAAAPDPAVSDARFAVRWRGTVRVANTHATATTGSYSFFAPSGQAMRITVNGITAFDHWADPNSTAPSTAVTLTEGTAVAITVDFYKATDAPRAVLSVTGPFHPTTPGAQWSAIVSPSWLDTEAPTLPQGWSMSGGLSGMRVASARAVAGRVSLIDPAGVPHHYTATAGGFAPPPGEDGVLARDGAGRLSLHGEDGSTYAFDAAGNLASATSGSDDRDPAAPAYTWATTPARLTAITDPLSGRAITLRYGGDATCLDNPPLGLERAPSAMLCKVSYWDGTESRLWYSPSSATTPARLARIEDPGSVVTDFAYDAAGRLSRLRPPLVSDAVAAGAANDDTTRTMVAYETGGKVASVTLPAPIADAARPAHFYAYTSATETRVHVAGLTEPAGFARKVTMDAAGRALSETDATNRTTTFAWDDGDRLVSSTDAADRRTTTIYDVEGRPTDAYGPAPASCFGTGATCATAPRTQATYDEAISGLALRYWDNAGWSGAPKLHRTGALTGASPDASLGSTWSARFTGEIALTADANLQVAGVGTTLWVDDRRVGAAEVIATGRHRVRIDMAAGASPSLEWRAPRRLLRNRGQRLAQPPLRAGVDHHRPRQPGRLAHLGHRRGLRASRDRPGHLGHRRRRHRRAEPGHRHRL